MSSLQSLNFKIITCSCVVTASTPCEHLILQKRRKKITNSNAEKRIRNSLSDIFCLLTIFPNANYSLSVNCFIAKINPSIANNVSTLKLNCHWLFGWEKEAKTDMKNSRVFHCIMRSGPLKFSWSWSLMQLLNGFVFSFSFEHWIKTFFTSKTNMQLVVLNLIFIKFHNFLCGSLSSECNEDIRCVCSLSSFVFNRQCYVFIVKTNDWRASYTECINLLGQPIKRHTFWRNSRCFYPAAQYHHIYYYSHL